MYIIILLTIVRSLLSLNIIMIAGSKAGIQQSNFYALTNTTCLCPGDTLRYECVILGGGTTLWRGSAFMTCDYIALLHSRFIQGTTGTCNSRSLIGKSLGVQNDCYTSQLNITASRELNETTIECVHDNGTQLLTVGTSKMKLKDLAAPPPDRITLSLVHPGWLAFSWYEVVTGCEVFHYRIVASNCGRCPTTTTHLTVVCTDIPTDSSICTFAVQTIVCDGIASNVSDPIHALLRVPDAPTGLKVIPRYSYYGGHISGITVEFISEMSDFKITDNINGSTLFYTIIYTNHDSESVCGSTVISASMCNFGTCKYTFDINSCPTSIIYNVSVFATNMLGNGHPSSITTTISDSTKFNVSVSFDLSLKQVVCIFPDHDLGSEKTCRVLYGPRNECRVWNSLKTLSSSVTNMHSDSIIIGLTSLPNQEQINCFIATLTSGMFVAEIEGKINTSNVDSNSTISDPFHRLILAISLGLAITVVAMAISAVIHIIVRLKAKKTHMATEPPVIYEDLDHVQERNKDNIDLENNMAYSAAHTQPH